MRFGAVGALESILWERNARLGMHLDLEALNRYVLMAVGFFGVLLYCGLLYAGAVEFVARISKKGSQRARSRKGRGARNEKQPVWRSSSKRT